MPYPAAWGIAKTQLLLHQRHKYPLEAAMFSEQAWEIIARSLRLSTRELQIVRGVFSDHTEFMIAADLRISAHTVHTHFYRLHHKLAVQTRVQLVLRVVQEFLALAYASGNAQLAI